MSGCDVTTLCKGKACTNKCGTTAYSGTQPVWVLAACEGAGILFKLGAQEGLVPISQKGGALSSQPMQDVANMLSHSLQHQEYAQLIVVGSPVDLAWAHSALPDNVTRSVIAEVPYPLLTSWFSSATGFSKLTQALGNAVGA